MVVRQATRRAALALLLLWGAAACGAAPPPPAAAAAHPPITDSEYRAVLATVYVTLVADARDAAALTYRSQAHARAAAARFRSPRMDVRIRRAMRAHGIGEAEMVAFARMRPRFVREQNRLHDWRMRELAEWVRRIEARAPRRAPSPVAISAIASRGAGSVEDASHEVIGDGGAEERGEHVLGGREE